jgi:uncharacterized protein (DUF305 family)
MRRSAMAISMLSILPFAALAQSMPGMSMPAQASVDSDEAKALKQANDEMMKRMDVPLSGDADRDFVANMIPHHQGAVDMARIELQYGHDPQLRALAQSIIKAQQTEIAEMIRWQETHDKSPK